MQLSPIVTDFLNVIQPLAIGGLIFTTGKLYQGFITVQKDLKELKVSTGKLLISQSKTETQLDFIRQFEGNNKKLSETVAVNCSRITTLESNAK